MKALRFFARVDQGIVMEVVPPTPLPPGLDEIIPEDGDVRVLYGFPPESWIEITGRNPAPQPNWLFINGDLVEPSTADPVIEE